MAAESSEKKSRILFVDDEKNFAQMMARLLQSQGFDVRVAFSGNDALDIFKTEDFDLLVTDLKMPVMDGIQLIRQIRKVKPDQPIVIVTGFPGQMTPWNRRLSESQEEMLKLGSLDCLVKPFTPERLLEVVNKALTTSLTSDDEARPRVPEVKVSGAGDVEKKKPSQRDKLAQVLQPILNSHAELIDGLAACSVVNLDGNVVAQVNPGQITEDVFAGRYAMIMNLLLKTFTDADSGAVKGNLVESDNVWSMTHFLGDSGYYLSVVVKCDVALGNLRTLSRMLAERLTVAIGEKLGA